MARSVSKLLPMVSMVTVPLAGAGQVHQTEAPLGLPAWAGSPVSEVAPRLDAKTRLVPMMAMAPAKSSLAGRRSRVRGLVLKPVALVALRVRLKMPLLVGIPEMTPLDGSRLSGEGRPLTPKLVGLFTAVIV